MTPWRRINNNIEHNTGFVVSLFVMERQMTTSDGEMAKVVLGYGHKPIRTDDSSGLA